MLKKIYIYVTFRLMTENSTKCDMSRYSTTRRARILQEEEAEGEGEEEEEGNVIDNIKGKYLYINYLI